MGRAPCCEKMGLKKGPWTPEEDHILVSFINQNGHDNWRALPKRAGLLRCGKSCRLRWMNYLRPDIKRGNFSPEEEETIIKLHQELGNRWSVIAARLPGRTDNEIKNVWHTNLKKRLSNQSRPEPEAHTDSSDVGSPQHSTSEISAGGDQDESFWSEVLRGDGCSVFSTGNSEDLFQFSDLFGSDLNVEGSTDFWCNMFYRSGDSVELPEF